jgi:hypothetical protein
MERFSKFWNNLNENALIALFVAGVTIYFIGYVVWSVLN